MRNEARHRMQQIKRAVWIRTADVHVLAKHRELLRQIAVQLGNILKTRRIDDLPVTPLLECMRAAAAQADVQMIGRRHQRVANLAQIGDGLLMRRANAGRQLDHAFGDFRRDVAGDFLVFDEAQQIRAGFGQIIIVRIDDLHFEFDTEGKRFRVDEGFDPLPTREAV